jgi:hypothetical protein
MDNENTNDKPPEKPVRADIATRFQKGNQLAKGHGFGRPEVWTEEKIAQEAALLEEWFENPKNFYLQTFATERGYTSKFYEKLAEKSPLFSQTLSRVREIQEARIVSSSLERKFDGNFAKFVLANRHGWREKTELSGDANSPLGFLLNQVDGKSKDIIEATVEEIKEDKDDK